jgi:5'-nucleotidase
MIRRVTEIGSLRPLILVTNDDGMSSPGLSAAAHAALPLGDVVVVAPNRQWSGAARSMPFAPEGRIEHVPFRVDGHDLMAYQIDASPALVVQHALFELVPRRPSLTLSGVNYGENLGTDVTISGTVGAALQSAACGIPALAVSLQTPKHTHVNPSPGVDFSAAIHFTQRFAQHLLDHKLPPDVDILKLDIPDCATPESDWRVTRASRLAYFVPTPPSRVSFEDLAAVGYDPIGNPEEAEPDSDIYAVAVDRLVAVTPVSLDLTSRVSLDILDALFRLG